MTNVFSHHIYQHPLIHTAPRYACFIESHSGVRCFWRLNQVYCINMYLRKYVWPGTQQQISFILWPKHRAVVARQRGDKTMVEVLFSLRKSPVRQYFAFKPNSKKESENVSIWTQHFRFTPSPPSISHERSCQKADQVWSNTHFWTTYAAKVCGGGWRRYGLDFISFSFRQTSSFSSKDLKQVLAIVKEKEWPGLLSKHREDEMMRTYTMCQCRSHQLL